MTDTSANTQLEEDSPTIGIKINERSSFECSSSNYVNLGSTVLGRLSSPKQTSRNQFRPTTEGDLGGEVSDTESNSNTNSNNVYNSDDNQSDISQDNYEIHDTHERVKYKKLSYNDVRRQISKSYEPDAVHRYSSALDILASYLIYHSLLQD